MSRKPRRGALAVTSPDKLIFPDASFTKRDLAAYYDAVADALLPQLRDRPISRVRFPDGVDGDRIFQRNVGRGAPPWLRTFGIPASPVEMGAESPGGPDRSTTVTYPLVDDREGLAWTANQASVELHTPQWRFGPRGAVGRPERLVIDLDPGLVQLRPDEVLDRLRQHGDPLAAGH